MITKAGLWLVSETDFPDSWSWLLLLETELNLSTTFLLLGQKSEDFEDSGILFMFL